MNIDRIFWALVVAISLSNFACANAILNGDFETGDLSGWSNSAGATIATGVSALDGTSSAFLPDSTVDSGYLRQYLPSVSTPVVTEFIFTMPDPGGPGDRGLNAFWDGPGGQINLRVVDLDSDSDGDVQIYQQGSGWQTPASLKDSVSFSEVNSLRLTLNDFGSSFDYDVTVNGATTTGLGFYQYSALESFDNVYFSNSYSAVGFTIDNVFVSIPEPMTLLVWSLLAGLGVGLGWRRRR